MKFSKVYYLGFGGFKLVGVIDVLPAAILFPGITGFAIGLLIFWYIIKLAYWHLTTFRKRNLRFTTIGTLTNWQIASFLQHNYHFEH